MLIKKITYKDFNGMERTEVFMFHLMESEIAEMELSTAGGFAESLEKIVQTQNVPEIIKEFNKEEILENIEFLEEHEIKIPSLAKMLYEFKKNGIEIKLEEWTKEELTNKIIEVAKKWT